MNYLKSIIVACVFFIGQPFLFIYAGPSSSPPQPNPPGTRTPFPGLGIEDYIPYLLFFGLILAFYILVQKQKQSLR